MFMYRSNRNSKLYILRKIDDDNYILVAIFYDLSDIELRQHYKTAIDTEDYEYAEECKAEIDNRKINVKKL